MDENTFMVEIYKKYEKQVHAYALTLCKYNYHDAKDITQEAFMKAWKHRDKLRLDDNVRAWLYKCARNYYLTTEKRSRFLDPKTKEDQAKYALIVERLCTELTKSNRSPSEELLKEERDRVLQCAIKKLPDDMREKIYLRYWQDLKYKEIAQILDKSEATIRSDMFRIRKELRELLKEYFQNGKTNCKEK